MSGSAIPSDVAGYESEQLANAAQIIRAGADQLVSTRDQTIAVMTAMGESGLRVLTYGDAAGPDSRGLFQQRDSWGTLEQRLDPYTSAQLFYAVLVTIPDRDNLEPTIVAHRVQRNADPYYYEKYWSSAEEVVAALTGAPTAACGSDPGPSGAPGPDGWVAPAAGPITSPFSLARVNPVDGVLRPHTGTDLGAGGCDGPIVAAHAGVVTFAGMDPYGTGTIIVDHGGDILTEYLHEYSSGILVRVGQQVTAGELIARAGSTGRSTGCHLHFEVHAKGLVVDPVPFMQQFGVTLG